MNAETDVILLGGRRTLSAEETERLERSLRSPLDWPFILKQGRRHGLLALLQSSLQRHQLLALLPADIQQTLAAAVGASARRNLVLVGELFCILRTLAAEGVSAIPFKGPVVAKAAYGDLCLRAFCDLDILVQRNDLTKARDILSGLGYKPGLIFSPQQEHDYLNVECALQMRQGKRDIIVELHWQFSERNASVALPIDEFWERSVNSALAGLQVRTLGTEDLVLYLCVHGAKHRWARLEWSCCIAELIRGNPNLDWEAVLERAENHRVRRMLNLGLWLATLLHEVTLPAFVQVQLGADRCAYSLAEAVRGELFSPPPNETHYQERAKRYLFMLRSREKWADRFRILLYSAVKSPHPQASEWMSLPPRFAFLHRVFRPMRLLSQYSLVAWRHYLRRGVS